MALAEAKKGGPYTKDNQESRRNEVARLHFEFGYSARKISDAMKISRNTVNADIRYLYDNLKEDVKQKSEDLIFQQLGRLEAQRGRIIDEITNEKYDKLRYERLLLDVDTKINNLLVKIGSENKPEQKLDESLIRELVLFLVIKYAKDPVLKKEVIVSELVNLRGCTIDQANQMMLDMERLGLECCKKFRGISFVYDLLEFVKLRRYITPNDEFFIKINALCILEHDIVFNLRLLEKRFMEKFGSKEKWDDKIFGELDKEKKKIIENRAESSLNIIIDILKNLDENIIDQTRFLEYIKYIRVYFGIMDDKTLIEKMDE